MGRKGSMLSLNFVFWLGGAVLEAAAITCMLRGEWRKYILLLTYLILTFLTGVMDISAWLITEHHTTFSSRLFWIDESLRNVFLLLLVFSLLWRYMDSRGRNLSRWLWLASAALISIIFLIHRGSHMNRYMTLVNRDFNFCATVLVLLLWAVLLGARSPDPTLLAITAGLGLACTGAAFGHAMRQISPRTIALGNSVLILSFYLNLGAWLKAFWPKRAPAKSWESDLT